MRGIHQFLNGWVNNREAGDLRHHRAHLDVTVMVPLSMQHSNTPTDKLSHWLLHSKGCDTEPQQEICTWFVFCCVLLWFDSRWFYLTHWGWVTYIYIYMYTCVTNLGHHWVKNGLSPVRRQAIIWTNAVSLSIGPLGTHFSQIVFQIQTFLFQKMHLKMSSGKCRPFYLGLKVVNISGILYWHWGNCLVAPVIVLQHQDNMGKCTTGVNNSW